MSRSLGHLPHHNPVQEFDRIILIDGAVAHHPVILIDGESIHFARGRERQRYGLSDRGHEARSWVRATCPGGGCGTPISRTRRPRASECSTIPQGIQTDLQGEGEENIVNCKRDLDDLGNWLVLPYFLF